MRSHHWVTLAASALILAACSSESVAPPPKPPIGSLDSLPDASTNKDLVTAKERALPDLYAEALSSSSSPDAGAPFAKLAPLLNSDLVEFSSPGMPPAHEAANIVTAHDRLFGAFGDRRMTLTRVWRTPNEQSLEWVMTGKHAREWMGIGATQKPVVIRGITLLWTKDDGTIVDIHVYFDVGLLKVQLSGVGPKDLLALPAPAAPNGPPQVFEDAPTGPPSDQGKVALVKGWLDALENNKEKDYVGAPADGAEIYTLESSQPLKAPDDVRKYFKATHKGIGQLDTIVNNAWGVTEYAIVEYDLDGEQLGSFSWLPLLANAPPRNTLVAHFDLVDVCEIRDGKIARIWRYDTPGQILGGSFAPPGADAGPQAGRRSL
jgi:hypothetical protein